MVIGRPTVFLASLSCGGAIGLISFGGDDIPGLIEVRCGSGAAIGGT